MDESRGWAAGRRSYLPELSEQVILHTADGGQTWETQYQQAPSLDMVFSVFRLDSIYFTDAQNGWAVEHAPHRSRRRFA
ncbi:MAG: hypothetical protein ACOYYS_12685 [Chloroflexota bacterium]